MNVVYKNKEIKNIGIYFITNIIAKLIPFFLLPIITRYLVPAEYGKWSIFSAILTFAVPFISVVLKYQIARKFYTLSKKKFGELVFNVIFVNVTLSVLALVIVYLLTIFDNNFITLHYLYLIPIIALLTIIKEYFLTILRYEKKPALYGFVQISSSVILYAIAVLSITQYNYKWEGMLLGSIASSILMTSGAFIYLLKREYIHISFNVSSIKDSLKIGLPLVPHAIGGSIIAMSDRLILINMLDVEAVGIYATGYSLGMTAQIAVDSFNKTWGPWIYEQLAKITDEKKKRIVKFTYIYYILLFILWSIVCILGYIYMIWFINPEYHEAIPVIYWAAGAAVIRGLYIAVFPYMAYMGKTIIYPIATGLSAVVNISLTIYLVNINGMVGAAQATAASFLLMFMLLFIYSQKKYPMPWFTFNKSK